MKDDLLASLFLRFAGISLLAVGGASAVLPEAHRQIVQQAHWLTNEQFAQTFAIAQTSPGPNVIVFSLFGWRLAGFWGLVVATLGILGPSSLLAYAVARDHAQGGRGVLAAASQKGADPACHWADGGQRLSSGARRRYRRVGAVHHSRRGGFHRLDAAQPALGHGSRGCAGRDSGTIGI